MAQKQLIDQEYLKSGQYFIDSLNWYNAKYLMPIVIRSWLFIICIILSVVLILMSYKIYKMFPVTARVNYAIAASNEHQQSAEIIKANFINNDPLRSIADIMIRNYINAREKYDYNNLQQQFNIVEHNSSKMVYRKFYDYMGLDTPDSPILKYQRNLKRDVKILNVNYLDNEIKVNFQANLIDDNNKIIEITQWQADLTYFIDNINLNLTTTAPFNFTITSYQLTKIKDLTISK